jgi:hypothetical protein
LLLPYYWRFCPIIGVFTFANVISFVGFSMFIKNNSMPLLQIYRTFIGHNALSFSVLFGIFYVTVLFSFALLSPQKVTLNI